MPVEGRGMQTLQAFDPLRIDMISGLAQQSAGEQAAAHADLSMDTPDREIDPVRIKRLAPSQHVLIDAVDQRPVEVEQKGSFWNRRVRMRARLTHVAIAASSAPHRRRCGLWPRKSPPGRLGSA